MDADELRKKLHADPGQETANEQRRKKNSLVIQIVVTVVIMLFVFGAYVISHTPSRTDGPPRACFKHDVCIDLIVVTTPEAQEIGLSNYSALPEDTGMLFIFQREEIQRMWMKDMSFPIDIFWISDKGRILNIEKKALPCIPPMTTCEIFEPNVNAKYVLETREGFAIESNLFDNDVVEFYNLPRN
ncbi:DUF192 domain-containing protein [Candidatus Woesearchaeota archaeon]|nr:DUF192 domain-containing protein [Candidatus Woesearchaeota archaeon]